MSADYKQHYQIFSENVEFAGRALYYHLTLNDTHLNNIALKKIIDTNARFWVDYRYMCLVNTVIFLGKIFDEDTNTHSITKLINSARNNVDYFKDEDIKKFSQQSKIAKKLWNNNGIKNLRNKIFAHDEVMSDEERFSFYKKVRYDDLKEIVRILFQISHALENAELNTRKPDFNYDPNWVRPANVAKNAIEKLFDQLSK